MKARLSEEEVLKKLEISDFRHMTKDKVIDFASALPDMEPDVAKKALEQFPSFKELASIIVTRYKAVVDRAFEENRISQQAFYDICNSILDSLKKELEADEIDSVERERIENKMLEVAKMIGEKDTENKEYSKNIIDKAGRIFVVVAVVTAALLGFRFKQFKPQDKDD